MTADLLAENVDVKMDITDIPFPASAFDVIFCSHVLEHVTDDLTAMREFHRVLKVGGWSLFLVPITAERTFEDQRITDPRERLKVFGQEDHVRRYGPDFVERLESAGFVVRRFTPQGFLSDREAEHMAINKNAGEIFFCRGGTR